MAEIGGKTKKYAPYYGRGILMLTHKNNYIKYSQYANVDAENNPDKLTSTPDCIISGVWAYSYLLKLNDKVEKDDFIYVTARINGGFNGYNARLSSFNKIVKTLKAEHLNKLCTNGGFKFEESEIYDNRVYSQEWGLWHDPHYPKDKGTGKNKMEALAGYSRALNLTPNDKKHEVIRQSLNNKINAL